MLLLNSCLGVCKFNHLLRTIPLVAWTLSYCGLMIIFGVLCHPFLMPLSLISLDSRLVCLAAWACKKHLKLLWQPFCVTVSVLFSFVLSICLPFQALPLPCLLFQVKSLLSLICLICFQSYLPLSYPRLSRYFNLSLMLVSPILCYPVAHFVIKLGFVPSLHTLVPVHGLAIPLVSLSLTMSSQELVYSVWYWLGIPILSSTDSVRCSCGSVVDQFGDHLLGCGHAPMRIHWHDALCDIFSCSASK